MKRFGSFGGCASDPDVFEELDDWSSWFDKEARIPVRMAVLSVPAWTQSDKVIRGSMLKCSPHARKVMVKPS